MLACSPTDMPPSQAWHVTAVAAHHAGSTAVMSHAQAPHWSAAQHTSWLALHIVTRVEPQGADMFAADWQKAYRELYGLGGKEAFASQRKGQNAVLYGNSRGVYDRRVSNDGDPSIGGQVVAVCPCWHLWCCDEDVEGQT